MNPAFLTALCANDRLRSRRPIFVSLSDVYLSLLPNHVLRRWKQRRNMIGASIRANQRVSTNEAVNRGIELICPVRIAFEKDLPILEHMLNLDRLGGIHRILKASENPASHTEIPDQHLTAGPLMLDTQADQALISIARCLAFKNLPILQFSHFVKPNCHEVKKAITEAQYRGTATRDEVLWINLACRAALAGGGLFSNLEVA